MNKIEWQFVQPLEDGRILEDFEFDYYFLIPDEMKELIQKNNAGIPDKGVFDFPRKGMVLAGLLSFNRGDDETVYTAMKSFVKDGRLTALPFGTDGFGNFVCVRDSKIVFWNHELDIVENIADSLSEFLNMLHD